MRTKIFTLAFLSVILLILINSSAWASWVNIPPKELVNKADVILLGTVQGKVGEEKLADGLWTTEWKVRVSYYLKGKERAQEMVVNTPGAPGKTMRTSADYALNEKGNQVLLFLRHREGFYEPLSPQGVVGVNKLNITKADYSSKEVVQLKAFIAKANFKKATEKVIIKPKYQSTWFTAKIIPALVILSGFVGILVGFLWLTKGNKHVK